METPATIEIQQRTFLTQKVLETREILETQRFIRRPRTQRYNTTDPSGWNLTALERIKSAIQTKSFNTLPIQAHPVVKREDAVEVTQSALVVPTISTDRTLQDAAKQHSQEIQTSPELLPTFVPTKAEDTPIATRIKLTNQYTSNSTSAELESSSATTSAAILAELEQCKMKLSVQDQIIVEFAKKVQILEKENADLASQNAKYLQDRNVAVQSKVDLLKIIEEKQALLAKQEKLLETSEIPERLTVLPRFFLNETEVLDAALQEFNRLVKDLEIERDKESFPITDDIVDLKHTPQFADEEFVKNHTRNLSDTPPDGQFISLHSNTEAYSVKRAFEPPNPLGTGLKEQFNRQLAQTPKSRSKTPNEGICRGRATPIPLTNFHSSEIHNIGMKAAYIQDRPVTHLSSKPTTGFSSNISDAISNLQTKLNDTSTSLHECINALIEEHRQVRRWKAHYEDLVSKFEQLKTCIKQEQLNFNDFLNKRQGMVNALLPIARPITADQDKWMHSTENPPNVILLPEIPKQDVVKKSDESTKGKPIEIVRIYIPKSVASYSACTDSIPKVHWNPYFPSSSDGIFSTRAKKVTFLEAKSYLESRVK